MAKRSRKVQQKASEKRVFHTKQKPKPRHVSKAHLQERGENQSAFDLMQRESTMKAAQARWKKIP
jgi:hypothetical protein